MSALFGNSSRSSGKNLVDFKAGKMHLRGKVVHPDKRKGQLYLYQTDDSLMHFCWKDRTSGAIEEDLMIFPGDCEYKKVAQCTTGRVYLLKFKSTNRKLFFWMQEPKTEKDDEYCRKINDLLNNPPAPGSRSSTGSTPSAVLGTDLSNLNLRDSDIHNFIGNFSHQQLMQIFGNSVPNLSNLLGQGSGGSRSSSASSTGATTTSASGTATTTSTSATPTATPTSTQATTQSSTETSDSAKTSSGAAGPIQLSDLQNILLGISVPGESGSATASAGSSSASRAQVPVDLGSAMTSEALQSVLTNKDFVEQLKPYLPPTEEPLPSVEQMKGTVASPQFQQAVTIFSHALQSGQLGPLINQFGLGEEAVTAASSCDMEAFVKALEKKKEKGSSKKESEKKPEKDNKDEDDSMAVD